MKKKLKSYQSMRNFNKTTEPKGTVKKKKKSLKIKKNIFVVQEHHARRLHFDFRLELEGVLKSWAVPKTPSIKSGTKRLAIETEDHPLEYAKFEGSIPKGEYGAGEVIIWDKGTWETDDDNPMESLNRGHLKFKLNGKKLKGTYILIRTFFDNSEKGQKKWIFMKHETRLAKKKIIKKKSRD